MTTNVQARNLSYCVQAARSNCTYTRLVLAIAVCKHLMTAVLKHYATMANAHTHGENSVRNVILAPVKWHAKYKVN